MIGLVVGVVRMILDMVMPPPVCGSGQADERISIIARVDFLHFSIINAIICLIAMVVISLLTKPRTEQQVYYVYTFCFEAQYLVLLLYQEHICDIWLTFMGIFASTA